MRFLSWELVPTKAGSFAPADIRLWRFNDRSPDQPFIEIEIGRMPEVYILNSYFGGLHIQLAAYSIKDLELRVIGELDSHINRLCELKQKINRI